MFVRILYFSFGLISFTISHFVILYMLFFTGNFGLSHSLDGLPGRPVGEALIIDLGLLLAFGLQHSVMARPQFKNLAKKCIPRPLERSFYCLAASLFLMLLMYFWEPIGGMVWHITHPFWETFFYFFFFLGWIIMTIASFLINHWDLFGMRQVYLFLRKRPYTALIHRDPFLYKKIRHPLYLGFLMAFWFSPVMSITHLLFALFLTMYILIGISYEEKDLVKDFGDIYSEYKKRVPKLLPKL